MNDLVPFALTVALVCEAVLLAMLLWSILVPARRLWPPQRVNWFSQTMVWPPTLAVFAAAILVGLAAWIIATGGVIAFALAPFAEEPWLEEVYGAPYRTYRKRTPRFFGFPSRQDADYSV